MLHRNINKFLIYISHKNRIMCLDMGVKFIGIALSDTTQLIAMAHSVYHRRNLSKDLGYLNKIFKASKSSAMVIGIPLEMSGQENEWCRTIIKFANKIIIKYKIHIYLQDESFSTALAIRMLKITSISSTKSKKIDDKISACIILQRALDTMNSIR
ncbi:Holliday junction resolvase RuvX [Wolbachia endosymbiont of Howardula sp.]|uniref:Holliday junction resolvase RuvX n=1 Tax=Wolbachia endosymbiont of Howardula sp. TaxID=2916816 RepID=UPI00217EFFC8|nr:Holliday junction resolvase RuvX [Wolbachia endosymbiont of Howardula sp.]UWI83386.1 Holliday junction resolvase RuvX [Wolbachia endosymbiont of Howardula sp.]